MNAVRKQMKFSLISALSCSLLPYSILALLYLFPALRQFSFFENHSLRMFFSYRALQGLSLTMVGCVSFFYWGAGIWNSLILSTIDTPGLSNFVGEFMQVLAVEVLLFILPLLSVTWALAFDVGFIPHGQWGTFEGNHGPWYFHFQLRTILSRTIMMPCPATIIGMLSCLFKPSWLSILITLACWLVFFFLIVEVYWLID